MSEPKVTRFGTLVPVATDEGERWDLTCPTCAAPIVMGPEQWKGQAAPVCAACGAEAPATAYFNAFITPAE